MTKGLKILQEGETGYGILIDRDGEYRRELNLSLLNENNQFVIQGDTLYVHCILQKSDTQNRNGRVYPKHILRREIEKYMELINVQSAIGESNHPNEINIDLSNIAHRVVKVWWEGDTVYGTIEILVSPSYVKDGRGWMIGDKIAEYLRRGIRLGISSRGIGSVRQVNGTNVVQEDFELVCFDLVTSPSTPDAYLFFDKPKTGMNETHNPLVTGSQALSGDRAPLQENRHFDKKLLDFLNKIK